MGFDEFFSREHDGLVKLCWLSTLDAEAAADVAQEAMARAWTNWDQISVPGSRPQAWVRTVALNLARSRWRRLARSNSLTQLLSGGQRRDARPPVSDPALLEALGELAVRQREAVLLRYWADLTVNECAEVMAVSPGSVKQHLTRAHQRLRNTLDPSVVEGMTL